MKTRLPWTWWDLGAVILFVAVGTAILIFTVSFFSRMVGGALEESMASPLNYGMSVAVYLLVLVGVWWFGVRRGGWGPLGLRPVATRDLLLAPLLLLSALFVAGLVNVLIARLTGSFDNPQANAITGGGKLSEGQLYALLLLVAGLVPFVEELFFRGMLYPLLRQHMHPTLAILCNGAIFALLHFIPIIFPALFILGVTLAYLRERTNSIIPSMLAHMLQNSFALIMIASLQK